MRCAYGRVTCWRTGTYAPVKAWQLLAGKFFCACTSVYFRNCFGPCKLTGGQHRHTAAQCCTEAIVSQKTLHGLWPTYLHVISTVHKQVLALVRTRRELRGNCLAENFFCGVYFGLLSCVLWSTLSHSTTTCCTFPPVADGMNQMLELVVKWAIVHPVCTLAQICCDIRTHRPWFPIGL